MQSALLLILTLIGPARAHALLQARRLSADLNNEVEDYHLSGNGLADALAKVSARFRLPMGIEWVREAETLSKIKLSWRVGTVRAVISAVVAKYPGYDWRADSGVVDVFPSDRVASQHNFLNLKVPAYFQVNNEVGGMVNQGLQSAVQDMVSPRKLPPGAGVGGSYATGLTEKPLTLALAGLTIRQALNQLTEHSEHKMWIVTFVRGVGLTPTGYWRTETLWHPSAFPDNQQPMWDFFTWSQYGTFESQVRPLPYARN
jgi:hypothetical protein